MIILVQQTINNKVQADILAALTEVSPVMLHCSKVVSSTTISPSKGTNKGAVLQLTADTQTTVKQFISRQRLNGIGYIKMFRKFVFFNTLKSLGI